jgi:hypothetical protein
MPAIVLMVRSPDAEALGAHRDFHLSAGVDAVIAAERSSGGAGEFVADWVIESGPTEFWWPRGGSLKDVLGSIPAQYGSVQAVVRHFVPVPDADGPLAERMIYRLSPHAAFSDPWKPSLRRVRRAGADGPPLRGWYPIEVFHLAVDARPPFTREKLERALGEGVVHVDTRLRDALRAIAAGRVPEFPRPDVSDEAQFALEIAALGEVDVIQTQARVDALEARLAAVESTLPQMLKRKLRRLARRTGAAP